LKSKSVFGIMLSFLVIGTLMLTSNIQAVEAEPITWYVDDGGGADFTRIQDAVIAASSGDTIYVYSGTYYENVIVNKNNLTLVGENMYSTVIDANWMGDAVLISANNTRVVGFTIQNSGWGSLESGVRVESASGNSISQNILVNNHAGILLRYSSDNEVTNNTAILNGYGGITLLSSSNNIVANNTASFNEYGISLSKDLYGSSYSNIVTGNIASYNEYGISLWYTSDDNSITCNNVSNNNYGIFFFDSSFNQIFHNNFIDNTVQVNCIESMNVWDNSYPSCGNHWSDYTDQDFFIGAGQNQPGSDGVWDHPYFIDDSNKDGYALVNPWTIFWIPPTLPPAGAFADLIQRQAWPEYHHYDISRHGDAGQTLHARVKNLGYETVWVKAVFKIVKEDGSARVIETEPLMIEQEEIAVLSANFGPLTEQDVGRYSVSAFCWYSHNKIVWVQGEERKTFSFTVVS
jgi:parallel beta-helix repeat protein